MMSKKIVIRKHFSDQVRFSPFLLKNNISYRGFSAPLLVNKNFYHLFITAVFRISEIGEDVLMSIEIASPLLLMALFNMYLHHIKINHIPQGHTSILDQDLYE